MRNDHFKLYAAVFPLIQNEQGEVLLHLRQNTGYMDGYWDLAGTGHIEANETATEALCRECLEELGITISPENLELLHTVHRTGEKDQFPYLYLYFGVKSFEGTPKILEPSKNAALAWFSPDSLPDLTIPDRKQAIRKAFCGLPYEEWRT